MSSLRYSAPRPFASHLFCALLLSLLTACGGGGPAEPGSKNASAADPSPANITETEEAALARGAALSVSTLADAEKKALAADAQGGSASLDDLRPGQTVPKSAYTSGAVARKALAYAISAYRFYNGSSGAHFYTTSGSERDNVIDRLSPPFSYEGAAFAVANDSSPGLSPVHRFYNTRNGVHFYTISEAERAHVAANLPHYTYEGVAYHASQVAGARLIPFHRFFVPSKGFHFYTASEEEKNNVIANLGATYRYEGIGYHVLDERWSAEKLPHTGVTRSTCYIVGSDLLWGCTRDAAGLNQWQDGFTALFQRMGYGPVPNPAGGAFPTSSCVRDEATGLVWEGKETSGVRGGAALFTHQGSNANTDVSGYLAAVNASRLCGHSDWRLPTRQELLGIVDYSRDSGPLTNPTWFVNSAAVDYWTSDALSTNGGHAWSVNFGTSGGWSLAAERTMTKAVRLVRGTSFGGPRFTYLTFPYGSDAANNVVNDAWTGLQWRRCEEGRVWSGSECTGTRTEMSHETALLHATAQSGWRMPNIKELASLTDLRVRDGARIDPGAFPGVRPDVAFVWATTPYRTDSSAAWVVNFSLGVVDGYMRSGTLGVRLLRANDST
jgi:Protein of unknown function (DUF1566)/Repeat of unknown function (DUF5648)